MNPPKPIYGRHQDLTATKKPTMRGELRELAETLRVYAASTMGERLSSYEVGVCEGSSRAADMIGKLLSREDLK